MDTQTKPHSEILTSWNVPFVAIEQSRVVSQFKKFTQLSELWNAPFEKEFLEDRKENWNEIFEFQHRSLAKEIAAANSSTTFFNQLQNTAWQYGKALAEKDWPVATIEHPHDAYLALSVLKVGALKHSDCFLLERKTKNACTFYWLSSPIEHTELCMLYHEVFRGYFYHLSRNIRAEIIPSILPSSVEKVKAWKINLLWID